MKKIRIKNIDLIRKYEKLRKQGKSYGDILKILGKSKRQFQRWNSYIKRGILTYPQN